MSSILPKRLSQIIEKLSLFSKSSFIINRTPKPPPPPPPPTPAPIPPPPPAVSDLAPISRKHAIDGLIARAIKHRRRSAGCPMRYSYFVRYAKYLRRTAAMSDFGTDTTSFYPILKWLQKQSYTSAMWRVVDMTRLWGLKPDSTMLNYIAQAYVHTEAYGEVQKVLNVMKEHRITPNSRTYHRMVRRAIHARDLQTALWLLRRMEQEGVQVLSSTHKAIVSEMLWRRRFVAVMMYVRRICNQDCEMGAGIYSFLGARLRFGSDRGAHQVVGEMVKLGLPVRKKLADFTRN